MVLLCSHLVRQGFSDTCTSDKYVARLVHFRQTTNKICSFDVMKINLWQSTLTYLASTHICAKECKAVFWLPWYAVSSSLLEYQQCKGIHGVSFLYRYLYSQQRSTGLFCGLARSNLRVLPHCMPANLVEPSINVYNVRPTQ